MCQKPCYNLCENLNNIVSRSVCVVKLHVFRFGLTSCDFSQTRVHEVDEGVTQNLCRKKAQNFDCELFGETDNRLSDEMGWKKSRTINNIGTYK